MTSPTKILQTCIKSNIPNSLSDESAQNTKYSVA